MKKNYLLHSSKNNNKLVKKYLKSVIKRYQTFNYIKQSYIVLFHESSAALDAILLNKPLVSLESKLLGDYLTKRTNNYVKSFGLVSINLDLFYRMDKNIITRSISNSK